MISNKPLHIVFSLSAAGSLREAIRIAGLLDEVVGLADNLACGSTDSADVEARIDFDGEEMGDDRDKYIEDIRAFWRLAMGASRPRIVWFSRWSAIEYCNFLAWLERNGDAPFKLIDLTDARLPSRRNPEILKPVGYTSLIDADQFGQHQLWQRATAPTPACLSQWHVLWQHLRAEEAPLRVIKPEGLASAPLNYFDANLLNHVGGDWIQGSLVVGKVLANDMLESFRDGGVFQCGDFVLFSRLRTLVEQGKLESSGDFGSRKFQVRRPN